MSVIRFEWDEAKNQSNIRKHQVSFGEAKSVFYDPNALLIHDPDHSDYLCQKSEYSGEDAVWRIE